MASCRVVELQAGASHKFPRTASDRLSSSCRRLDQNEPPTKEPLALFWYPL